MAAPGENPNPDDCRWGLILYPSKPMVDGTCSISYGVSPTGALYYLPPEMIHPDHDGVVPAHNCSTWLSSAAALTDAHGFMNWYYRSHCQQLAYFHCQIPKEFGIHLDLDALRRVFYIQDADGQRVEPVPWVYRPETNLLGHREKAAASWRNFSERRAAFVSSTSRNVFG